MLKKELRTYLLVVFIWLLVITLLRWSWQWGLIGLWFGAFIGTFLIDLDHFIYLFFTNPHELTSQRAQRLWEQKHLKELIVLIFDTSEERIKLAFHNILFQLILFVLCLFVLTSTGNLFGSGLVMGMMLHLLRDEVGELLSKQEERLKKRLFWQVNFDISFSQQKLFVVLMVLFFVVLSLFLI